MTDDRIVARLMIAIQDRAAVRELIEVAKCLGLDECKPCCGQRRDAAWETLPKGWTEDSLRSMWNSLTGDAKHKISACAREMEGVVDDPYAFCGSLASRLGER